MLSSSILQLINSNRQNHNHNDSDSDSDNDKDQRIRFSENSAEKLQEAGWFNLPWDGILDMLIWYR